jgi:hypothetical protein
MEMYGIEKPYEHIMNYVLDQKIDSSYVDGGFLPVGKTYSGLDSIENSPRLADYKRVLNKIHIQNEITTRVDDLCKLVRINEKVLGAHVRMTTMAAQINYGTVTYEDYCKAIDKELETGIYERLYVSTDNVESLVKMENRYRSIICYYPNLLRLPTEQITGITQWGWEYDMFFRKKYWQESFMEAMTLARCGGLVCRDSNFSNAAIVFSNTIKQVSRIIKTAG